ncbi:spore germination protein KA [Ruminiclostridium sufflavum DSM 19573]|uniref:Spore germination protein KA n=1 Tax=Ruminiclostridium sufflavum DSM 19573 TaxID=1121337 RepID=A0A318XZV4_9FIRM|nr:spore germination protein [Ruminiclostridium sufflavum]PYG88530.1 spore germination protein KA [Ruminiclostridium sufflavum DSM 19573]
MGLLNSVGRYFIYKEKEKKNNFILKESKKISCEAVKNTASLDLFDKAEAEGALIGCTVGEDILKNKISKDMELNKKVIKTAYDIPKNSDLIFREFNITVKEKTLKAFIVFIDGMTNGVAICNFVLEPLMLLSNIEIKDNTKDVGQFVFERLIPYNQIKKIDNYSEIINNVNFGGCGIFVEGLEYAFAADTKTWEHRGIEAPKSETVIRGPQEAFNEQIRANTALIRKILKDKDLMIQSVSIGERSNTPCAVMYIRDIANDSLVHEVLKRVKSIKVDYIFDSGELEQFLEDSTFMAAPQIFATERPDKVAMMLSKGNVAVILDGSPQVLVMPATVTEFLHTTEDTNVRFPYVNFIRAIRITGVAIALLLPGIYIAITNFHQEMIPTNLLFAIEASRENVPFPSVIEMLIMEFSFELIREAGLRVPGAIGSTIGIVGGLILGQAAVTANVVSPIMIIIVAITALGSFTVPSFSMSFSIRIMRFLYIILGASAGFLGISLGLVINSLLFASSKSFGVPFLTPFAPVTKGKYSDKLTRKPMWKQEERPEYLNVKDVKSQPKVSRGWTVKDSDKEDDE